MEVDLSTVGALTLAKRSRLEHGTGVKRTWAWHRCPSVSAPLVFIKCVTGVYYKLIIVYQVYNIYICISVQQVSNSC